METLACGSCSHSSSRSPKPPLVFLQLDRNTENVFYFLNDVNTRSLCIRTASHKLARVIKQTTTRTISQMVLFAILLVKSIYQPSISYWKKKKKKIHMLWYNVQTSPHSSYPIATGFITFSLVIKDPASLLARGTGPGGYFTHVWVYGCCRGFEILTLFRTKIV